ncbi:MAG TPA: hypothetical protein DCS93_38125 [Microscillaceae bacterium]|nr:hypothetical protein [Microscillaceae bacterium]
MKISSSLRKLTFEFISILFAVLLALFLNQCKEDRKNRKLGRQSEKEIIKEIRDNFKDLKQIQEANQARLKSFREWKKRYKKDSKTDYKPLFGFDHALLHSNGWQNAVLYQAIPHMRKDFVKNASEIYSLQRFYMSYAENYFNSLGNELHADDSKRALRINVGIHQLSTITKTADLLLEAYKGILPKDLGKSKVPK